MTASALMAKPSAPTNVALTYPATTAYKQWVWKEIRRRGWVLQTLVDEMKRQTRKELAEIGMLETFSTSTLINLLGGEEDIPPPTNCKFMPALNKVLGLAPPPVCDPTDELAQLVDRFRSRWVRATPRERAALLALVGGADDDPSAVDGDSDRTGEGSREHDEQ